MSARLGARLAAGARASILALAALAATVGFAAAADPSPSPGSETSTGPSAGPGHVPVLAYYYIWYNESSWTHTKTDWPALGPYDSTNPAVIHQQVAWAKESGVDALIVSWKSTPALNKALGELIAECQSQGLKLVLLYEGLDVNRNPISVATVRSDLVSFMNQYASDPVFDVYGKPAIVWSGTWRFSDSDVASVRSLIGAPDNVLLLGSEKSAQAYSPRASLFDGNAYYWSSADPLATPGYQNRLNELSNAVHAAGGLWLAPAPAGFDARLNGGTSTVDRRDGQTLRTAWADALVSKPDGLAVISWNEFTENSYVEPSQKFGLQYLKVLASLTGAPGPVDGSLPTAAPATATDSPTPPALASPAGAGSTGRGVPRPAPLNDYTSAIGASLVGLILLAAGLPAYVIWKRRMKRLFGGT